jgi:hypothetical protein
MHSVLALKLGVTQRARGGVITPFSTEDHSNTNI